MGKSEPNCLLETPLAIKCSWGCNVCHSPFTYREYKCQQNLNVSHRKASTDLMVEYKVVSDISHIVFILSKTYRPTLESGEKFMLQRHRYS